MDTMVDSRQADNSGTSENSGDDPVRAQVRVKGIVQGVGFRPTVWRYANALGIDGNVRNDGEGVLIDCRGRLPLIRDLIDRIQSAPPPNARINSIDCKVLAQGHQGRDMGSGFVIVTSDPSTAVSTHIGADLVTCRECQGDIFEPGNRRQGYPFANCTHCGPRLSITRQLPYDRSQTSMESFVQCHGCQGEYDDPADRRFHAQPNACAHCGPSLWLTDASGSILAKDNVIGATVNALRDGLIVAMKGLGGYQLVVDPSNEDAVARLRRRKHRPHKPFALMAQDLASIEYWCSVSKQEAQLLTSAAGPIVTLRRLSSCSIAQVAPDQGYLGFMLPTTPLHHLLLAQWRAPLIMTSANPSGRPQCISNEHAETALADIADQFLHHDRDIVHRVDDSVVQVIGHRPQIVRRARGYAPEPLPLPKGFKVTGRILAMGGDLKNTFCLLDKDGALLSQHIGDLTDSETLSAQQTSLALYRQMKPGPIVAVAVDQHPQYQSTRLGESLAAQGHKPSTGVHRVQHHHAHAAACLGENAWPLNGPPVLAITLDGMGYADESTADAVEAEGGDTGAKPKAQHPPIWGGEILLADYCNSRVVARLKPTPLPGGDRAMQQPWRNLLAHLHTHLTWSDVVNEHRGLACVQQLLQQPVNTVIKMMENRINAPLSSSCGRLFDAVAAALNICAQGSMSYEGQAAMQLQSLWDDALATGVQGYTFGLEPCESIYQIDPASMWTSLLADLAQGAAPQRISTRFHLGLARAVANTAIQLAAECDVQAVALSGGVFQNRHLHLLVESQLESAGLEVLAHSKVPANDGGLAFGQALVCAARLQQPGYVTRQADNRQQGVAPCA